MDTRSGAGRCAGLEAGDAFRQMTDRSHDKKALFPSYIPCAVQEEDGIARRGAGYLGERETLHGAIHGLLLERCLREPHTSTSATLFVCTQRKRTPHVHTSVQYVKRILVVRAPTHVPPCSQGPCMSPPHPPRGSQCARNPSCQPAKVTHASYKPRMRHISRPQRLPSVP